MQGYVNLWAEMYNLGGKTYDIICIHVLKGQSVWLSYCRTLSISRQEALQWEGLWCTASASIKIICGEMWACTHTHTHTHCPLESKTIMSGSVVETESISWHMPSSHTSWARQRSCTVSLTSAVAVVPVARAREDGRRRVLLEMCFRNAEHWYLQGWEQVPGGCPTERRCPRCCRSHPPPPVYAPDRGQRHISI